jgi:hypothetical protein
MSAYRHSRHCRVRLRHFRHSAEAVPSLPMKSQQLSGPRRLACAVPYSMPETQMFRISTIDTDRERRLIVEGTLVQPWVSELRRTWGDAGNSLEGRTLVIDLTNATVISREGEAEIFELMKEGAKFSCAGVLIKHVLKGLAHRCNTNLENVLTRKRSRE